MKHIIAFITLCMLLTGCDSKKAGVGGKVVYAVTGEPVSNALVSFVQCKSNGDNCTEVIIGQVYTNQSGEFLIDKKVAGKSKTKWITVYKNNKKLAQKDNVGLNDKNITIEIIP